MIEYAPHDFQKAFHSSDAKIRVVSTGRQSGKTLMGTIEALRFADLGAQRVGRPLKGRIIAPTYSMLSDINIPMMFEWMPEKAIKAWNKQEKRLTILNNSEITFRSADDPDKLRGWTGDWLWMDEASFYQYGRIVWETIQPGLVAKNGNVWITTTPQGKDWVYTDFLNRAEFTYTVEHMTEPVRQEMVMIKHKGRKVNSKIHAFRYRTMDNPYIPIEVIEEAKKTYSDQMFKQEYMGSIEQFSGLVFPDFDEEVHLKRFNEAEHDHILYFITMDVGFTNPTAILLVAEDRDNNLYVVDEYYSPGLTVADIAKEVRNLMGGRKISAIIIDPASKGTSQTSSMSVWQQLNQQGINTIPGDNDVIAGINRLTQFFKSDGKGFPMIFIDPRCENLVRELHKYSWKPDYKQDGSNKDERPIKMWDHAVDSLRYLSMFRPDHWKRPEKDRYGRIIHHSQSNLMVSRPDPDMY